MLFENSLILFLMRDDIPSNYPIDFLTIDAAIGQKQKKENFYSVFTNFRGFLTISMKDRFADQHRDSSS